uniref:Ig-like domain-containing protein n=1 Tax=Oreochromis aureus TaxID=47969 RepID=A0AAZ1XSL1_OREAU
MHIHVTTIKEQCYGERTRATGVKRRNGAYKVIQEQGDVIAAEGDTVTLGCRYETTASYSYLFWYKQELNDFPKYVLQRGTTGTADNAQEFPKDRFDAELNKKSVPLKIQKLQLSDSAVYYCALQPTVTGNTKTLYKNLWRNTKTLYKNLWIELIQ